MRNKLSDSDLQSKTIAWLRLPLVICVVFIHSFGPPETAHMREINYLSISGMDMYNIIRVWGSHVVTYICNSCFFMFSGYLFFFKITKWNKETYFKKLRSRITALVVPYLLWNIIPILAVVFISITGRIIKQDGDWGRILAFFNTIRERGVWNIFWNYNQWGGGGD
ncbi:MAG: acyltransferase [Treponema sp.]|jgi:hypothetical protein|nr:acyltransferase [Treponema sp.]